MKYPFATLVDKENMQGLLDSFCNAVGIASAIIDLDGIVIVGSNWQRICTDCHRVNNETFSRCIESDTELANQLNGKGKHAFYRCKNGLSDAAAPIILEGEHVANFFVGQFFLEKPDIVFFKKQAAKYDFDMEGYLRAVDEVPIIPKEKLSPILNYLSQFAQTLAEISLKEVRRREAESALLKSEAELRAIIENSAAGITVSDLNGRVLRTNPAHQNMFGYSTDEFSSMTFSDFTHPDDVKKNQASYEDLLSGKSDHFTMIKRFFHKDGHVVWAQVTVSLIVDNNKKPLFVIGIVENITERKKAEEEKKELESHLRQAYKMEAIGTMAGGIAHDFNNILTIIIGNAAMAFDDIPDGNPARHSIEQILQASIRAKNLVKQILAFSRQADKELAPLKPNLVIRDSMKLLRSTIPTTVKIREDIDTQCGIIKADPTQLNQLLMNLSTNAVDAMDEKGVLIVSLQEVNLSESELHHRPGMTPGPYVKLSVSDSGVGMDKEMRLHIFDAFFSTKEVGNGTGMGLAVVHGIVESHGGMIAVDSEPGEGTTFHIFFPVIEGDEVWKPEDAETVPTGNERILFIDDVESIAVLGSRILERQGYQVRAIINSADALETFKASPEEFDLVVTDQTMPNMSGAELAVELLKVRPDIPIILCTGYSSKISEEKAKEIGIRKFCMKPLDRRQLAKTVRKVLDDQ